MEFGTLELERQGPVLRVWLNRPRVRNALDDQVLSEIAELFTGLAEQYDVRAVVLGGRGAAFSSGADRRNPPGEAGTGGRERRWRSRVGYRACQAIADCEAFTVARLHGYAIGGGLALALACDFRVATESTRLRLPEVALGIPLTWGTVARLTHEIGASRARELIVLAEWFDARRADALGVLHRVVPDGALDAEVDNLVERLVDTPELAGHITKTQFQAYAGPRGDASFAEADLRALAMRSPEARAAFGAPD